MGTPNTSSIGGDANKFFSIGGSAGATLFLAIANYLVATSLPTRPNAPRLKAAATMHWKHILPEYKSMYRPYGDNVGAPIIDKGSMEVFYGAAGLDPKDPILSSL